jgi:ferredoxin
MVIVVDAAKCDGCGECVTACAVEAIQLVDGKPVVDDELCIECGACEAACPTGALEMTEVSEKP